MPASLDDLTQMVTDIVWVVNENSLYLSSADEGWVGLTQSNKVEMTKRLKKDLGEMFEAAKSSGMLDLIEERLTDGLRRDVKKALLSSWGVKEAEKIWKCLKEGGLAQ